jgi:hypothetical protein
MNAASILRSKTVAIASAGFLGAGLLGGVAFAAVPATSDTAWTTTPISAPSAQTTDEKARAKLKAVLDALVAKNVITQAQEDVIVSALTADRAAHPKLREFVGDVAKESVSYLGLPADQVKQQLRSGKSLGEIANTIAGKSRDGLLADLDAKAKDRIQAAVDRGTITQAQADQLRPKVLDGIVKVVDHKGSPKPTATN